MADNLPRISIDKDWLDLNSASGIAIGTAMKIQNVGGNRVDVVVSVSIPTTDIGEVLEQFKFFGVVAGETSAVWAKTHAKSGGAELSVQDDT